MKTPAELAARLRKMVLAAQHHYSPTGEPLRSIVVTPEWLEDMADAANALDADPVATDGEIVTQQMIEAGAKAACEYMERTGGNSPEVIYRAMRAVVPAAPAMQWRKVGSGPWWDGIPDDSDGNGPYERRTVYATHAAPVARGCGINKI